jgi:hypothetical protein
VSQLKLTEVDSCTSKACLKFPPVVCTYVQEAGTTKLGQRGGGAVPAAEDVVVILQFTVTCFFPSRRGRAGGDQLKAS